MKPSRYLHLVSPAPTAGGLADHGSIKDGPFAASPPIWSGLSHVHGAAGAQPAAEPGKMNAVSRRAGGAASMIKPSWVRHLRARDPPGGGRRGDN